MRNKHLLDKRIRLINIMIDKVNKSNTIRLILDGSELAHDFDQSDVIELQKTTERILTRYRTDCFNDLDRLDDE